MIRFWTPNDINQLIEIENAVHVAPWDRNTFLMCMQQKYPGFVILSSSENELPSIIGFVVFSVHAEECHLLNLSVALNHQHQGIGKQLLTYLLTKAKADYHATVIYLEVRRSNTRAINLYEQFGFVQIAERKEYYKGPHETEDALILAKLLSTSQN